MAWSVRVTPLMVAVDGLPEPEVPGGYLMTIVLGQLLLQGVRMTTTGLEVTAGTSQGMPRIWPGIVTARWPEGEPIGDSRYQAFALGRDLRVQEPHITLRPWKPAAELPASELAGDLVELPGTAPPRPGVAHGPRRQRPPRARTPAPCRRHAPRPTGPAAGESHPVAHACGGPGPSQRMAARMPSFRVSPDNHRA